jgi:hypothetical protein
MEIAELGDFATSSPSSRPDETRLLTPALAPPRPILDLFFAHALGTGLDSILIADPGILLF